MNTQAIQRTHSTGLVSMDQWHTMREQADVLVKSGFLPREVTTAEKALAIIQKGLELGIPPMYALSNIAIINGKPVACAEVLLALIYRDHGDDAIHFTETTGLRCTISYARRTWTRRESFTFTLEDAKRAQLLGKDNWQKYPDAMLRARCVSAVARLAFPDSISGLYTPEEMGAAVDVNPDTGEITTVESTAREIRPESEMPRVMTAPAAPGAAQRGEADTQYPSAPKRGNGASTAPAGTQPQADDADLEADQKRVSAVLRRRMGGVTPTIGDVTQEFAVHVDVNANYRNATPAQWHALAEALEAESPAEDDAEAITV